MPAQTVPTCDVTGYRDTANRRVARGLVEQPNDRDARQIRQLEGIGMIGFISSATHRGPHRSGVRQPSRMWRRAAGSPEGRVPDAPQGHHGRQPMLFDKLHRPSRRCSRVGSPVGDPLGSERTWIQSCDSPSLQKPLSYSWSVAPGLKYRWGSSSYNRYSLPVSRRSSPACGLAASTSPSIRYKYVSVRR